MRIELLLLLTAATLAAAAPSCSNTTGYRTDCGYVGISKSECLNKSCCWSPVSPNPDNLPWCFVPGQSPPVPPRPAPSSGKCEPDKDRVDCGYVGIQQQQCEDKGCCWSPVSPNPENEPWCFFKYTPPAVYKATDVQQSATGVTATLVVENGTDSERVRGMYGEDISPLKLAITYQSDSTVRIMITDPNNDRWQIPDSILPVPQATGQQGSLQYSVQVEESPFAIKVVRSSDGTVVFDTSVDAFVFQDQFIQIATRIASAGSSKDFHGPNIYGLGEHRDPLKLASDDHTYTMWNRDDPTPIDQNAYGDHPFFLELRAKGMAHGAFLRNSNGLDVTVNGGVDPGVLKFRIIGGVVDMFVFAGPSPKDVVQQYHEIIGRPYLPPYWSLGWHQCRYGYPSIDYVEEVVANYSKAKIPLDTIWNDIDHMDKYMDFTFDPVNYPVDKVKSFVSKLHANGQQYVVILDPGIHNVPNYTPYSDGLKLDVYIKEADGTTNFVGKVWPGSTVFPDWFHPSASKYWQTQIAGFLDQVPIDGLWIDMNEISNFGNGPPTTASKYNDPPYKINNCGNHSPLDTKTIAMDCKHHGNLSEYNVHNLFGLMEGIATREALESIYQKRSFVLSRSTFAGSGHHVAHWTGDNWSTFDSMASSIRTIMAFNMFGVPLVGSDICGFLGDTTLELCSRWTALGAFYPFSRNHDTKGAAPQEPYLWPQVAGIARQVLGARYSLLPYYYTLFYQATVNGGTVARPLFMEFPADVNTTDIDTQMMIGPGLVVSPVLEQGATSVDAYFPKARWYDFWTRKPLDVYGDWRTLDAPITYIPVHLRGGTVFPMQQPDMTTAATRKNDFELLVALDESDAATGSLFWDDGVQLQVGAEALRVSFAFNEMALTAKVEQSNLGAAVPPVTSVQFIGVQSSVSGVNVIVDGGAPMPHSQFKVSGEQVLVADLSLDLTKPFQVVLTTSSSSSSSSSSSMTN